MVNGFVGFLFFQNLLSGIGAELLDVFHVDWARTELVLQTEGSRHHVSVDFYLNVGVHEDAIGVIEDFHLVMIYVTSLCDTGLQKLGMVLVLG
jgi:hypothetical protein